MATRSRPRRALLVGPLGPPHGGATRTFADFVDAAKELCGSAELSVINTTPGYRRTSAKIGLRDVVRWCGTTAKLISAATRTETLVVFTSERSFVAWVPLFLLLRWRGIPVIVKFFGNVTVRFVKARCWLAKRAIIFALRQMTNVLVQTGRAAEELVVLGVDNCRPNRGFRRVEWSNLPPIRTSRAAAVTLVYLGLISRPKGAMEVLHAVNDLASEGIDVRIDFAGEVGADVRLEFQEACAGPGVCSYVGEIHERAVSFLSRYDALVLYSVHPGEGHAGVVIEAMAAGIPAIVSRHGGLPELVANEVNGLVVAVGDPLALRGAIRRMVVDPEARARMAIENRARLANHDVARVAREVLELAGLWPQL